MQSYALTWPAFPLFWQMAWKNLRRIWTLPVGKTWVRWGGVGKPQNKAWAIMGRGLGCPCIPPKWTMKRGKGVSWLPMEKGLGCPCVPRKGWEGFRKGQNEAWKGAWVFQGSRFPRVGWVWRWFNAHLDNTFLLLRCVGKSNLPLEMGLPWWEWQIPRKVQNEAWGTVWVRMLSKNGVEKSVERV